MRAKRMLTPRHALLALVALAAAIAGVWGAAIGGAGPAGEPARFARAAKLAVGSQPLASPSPAVSALVGQTLIEGRSRSQARFKTGQAVMANKGAAIGGGDEIIAALTGPLVPAAVRTKDGTLTAYSAWHQIAELKRGTPGQGLKTGDPVGIPSIRVLDQERDRLVAKGAYSPALSLDGRLAFTKGGETVVTQNQEYIGQVMVGDADGSSFAAWTTEAARYFPYAWANDSLLVYQAVPDSGATDLYAYTAPGKSHLVAADASAIALSPEGSRVLLTAGRRMVEVVRISDGAVESSMALDGPGVASLDSASTPHALMYGGSWLGSRVVANSDVGLVVLNVDHGLKIESVFSTPYPHGVIEPTFTSDSQVVGWVDLDPVKTSKRDEPTYQNALVSCDLHTVVCSQGDERPGRSWTRWVGNPSR